MIGVVIATLITAVLRWVVALYLTQKLVSFDVFPKPIQKQMIAGVIMFTIIFPIHRMYGVTWWGDLLTIVGIGAAVYWLVLFAISSQLRIAFRSLRDHAPHSK